MSSRDYIPSREAERADWLANFDTRIGDYTAAYGLLPAQAAALSALYALYLAAYNKAIHPATKGPSATLAKKELTAQIVAMVRALVRQIQGVPTVTDQQRHDLGITVRKTTHTPVPPPATEPVIEIGQRFGTTVEIFLHAVAGESRRSKPATVQGAGIYTMVAPQPSNDPNDWDYWGNTTRTTVKIQFPPTLPVGTVVWITANWYNAKGQTGNGCTAVSAILAGGGVELGNA